MQFYKDSQCCGMGKFTSHGFVNCYIEPIKEDAQETLSVADRIGPYVFILVALLGILIGIL